MVIVRLRNMTAIDSTGLRALETIATKLRDSGRTVIMCGMRSQPRALMMRAEFQEYVPAENLCRNVRDALARARAILRTEVASA